MNLGQSTATTQSPEADGNANRTQTMSVPSPPARQTSPEPPGSPDTAPSTARTRRRSTATIAAYPQLVVLAAAVATTGLTYLSYFGDRSFLIAIVAAAAGGVLVTALTLSTRWPPVVSVALSVVGFALVGVFAVFRSTLDHGVPTGNTFVSLGSGVVLGWARMLSTSLPADPTGDLVIVPALVTWIAAAVSAAVVVRTRTVLAPMIAPVVAFGVGLLFTAGGPVGGFVLVGAVLAELLLLGLLRAGAADPLTRATSVRATLGKLAFGLPVILVATAVGVAGAMFVPVSTGSNRFDLRDVVPVNLAVGDTLSPLVTLKTQLSAPAQDLFTVRLHGDTAGVDRIRVAALDNYDGALWTSRDQFLLAGHHLPADTGIVDPRQVTMNVTIKNLPGPYLPELGVPTRMTAPRFGYSTDSADLATDASSITGLSYDLSADLPRTTGLDSAVPSVAGSAALDTQLPPGLPPEIQDKGAELAGAVAAPYAKLLAIQNYLRTLPYSLSARPGQSYDALRRLFSSNLADQAGYAEQFAAAFAVLARSQGFPARVAVGYLLNPADKHGDTYTVTSHDAHAWAEVNLAGYGWVSFEPTDPQHHPAVPPQQQKQQQTAANNDNNQATHKASQPTVDPNLRPVAVPTRLSPLDWALLVLIGLGVLLLLTPVTVAAEKFRRRAQRRSGSRAARIIGAWQDAADRLVEHGVPVTAASTAVEVAEQATELLGERAEAVTVLAPLAVAAAYNPLEPEEDLVGQAWQLNARLRRDLRRSRGPLGWVGVWFDPRSLSSRWTDRRRMKRALDALTRG